MADLTWKPFGLSRTLTTKRLIAGNGYHRLNFVVLCCPPLIYARLGWAVLNWAGLGWAGLGWAGLGWAGQGWAGLGRTGQGRARLDWTGGLG